MGLKEQLSLTQNGGVYYEGTRVTPTKEPVLFVGLGGTGIDALLRVKNEVQTRMPLPKGPNGQILRTSPVNIGFLAVDTDQETLKKAYGVAGFDKSGDEFINISVDGLPQVISNVVEKHLDEDEWKWYDRNLTANGGLDGANGVRQIGRFMLFQSVNTIIARFTSAIEQVLTAADGNSIKIFILTGIGGGTGSGTFLDIAYILREIALAKTPNAQIHGYIFTPDLNKGNGGDNTSMYRNGFASLKELDYWMSANEHQKKFVQRYNGKFIVNSKDRPFDYCHIITARDSEHNLVSYKDAMDAVGGNLFSYIVSEDNVSADGNTALKSMYDNIASHIVMADKPYAANYNYLSIGSDKIEIPYTEITTLVAARIFTELKPVFENAPDSNSFGLDMRRLELTPEHLWNYIHKGVMADPVQGKDFRYGEIWPSNAPYQRAQQWLIHAQQVMRQNKSNLHGIYEGKFREYITTVIKNMNQGPCYAARLINSNTSACLIKTLEGFKADCAERMSTCSSRAGALQNKLNQAYAAGSNAGLLGRGNATKEYVDALNSWLGNEYGYWAYYELIEGIGELITRLRKYYDRIFKNLQDSLCALPDIFDANVAKIVVDEQEARKRPETTRRLLIRPLEFEAKYKESLTKKIGLGAAAFLTTIGDNIKQWVGLELDEIDIDLIENTDIGACIAKFINDNFGDTITMNMESLLIDRTPSGSNSEEYIRETLDGLKKNAVPLFHTDVAYSGLDIKSFSMISVPNDCPRVFAIANHPGKPIEDRPKMSAERSKLQWVKVQAGMPLYAFPEVAKMEEMYELAMKTSRDTRKGVHLCWEWREELPSPLPEATWPDDVKNETFKEFAKEYNARIRKAFDLCAEANIIRPTAGGDAAMLYIADESVLDNLVLHGTLQEKKAMLDMVRAQLWTNEATAIRLNPFGKATGADLMGRVRENNLRFWDISQQIEKQAAILARFEEMTAGFENVSQYVNAIFANLVFDQGFETKFRRSALDYAPIKLFDKMTQSTYPDYDTYMAFTKILNKEIRENIATQFDNARRELIAVDGSFNMELVNAKVTLLKTVKDRYAQVLTQLQARIAQTPIDQRETLVDTSDFYEKSIEIIDNTLRIFGVQI